MESDNRNLMSKISLYLYIQFIIWFMLLKSQCWLNHRFLATPVGVSDSPSSFKLWLLRNVPPFFRNLSSLVLDLLSTTPWGIDRLEVVCKSVFIWLTKTVLTVRCFSPTNFPVFETTLQTAILFVSIKIHVYVRILCVIFMKHRRSAKGSWVMITKLILFICIFSEDRQQHEYLREYQ